MVPKSVGSNSYSMDAATFFAGVGLSDMVQYVTNNSYVCLIELSAEFGEVMVYAFGKTPLMYFVD